jgi:hypothetical protein
VVRLFRLAGLGLLIRDDNFAADFPSLYAVVISIPFFRSCVLHLEGIIPPPSQKRPNPVVANRAELCLIL